MRRYGGCHRPRSTAAAFWPRPAWADGRVPGRVYGLVQRAARPPRRARLAPSRPPPRPPRPAASPAASYELESELFIYNWSEYVSEKNKAEFTARVPASPIPRTSSPTMKNWSPSWRQQAGTRATTSPARRREYCPGMIEAGFLQKLDMSRIPNFQYINATFKNTAWDPNNEYHHPQGLRHDRDHVPPEARTRAGDQRGRSSTIWRRASIRARSCSSIRWAMCSSFPLKMLGYSVNAIDHGAPQGGG